MEKLLIRIAWFVALILLQVIFLNNIYLFELATPFLYLYLILILNADIDRITLMVVAFVLGVLIDVFSNTPGVNAAAAVFIAFVRPGLLRLFSPREEYEDFEPSIRVLGIWPFLKYTLAAVLLHHSVLFLLEAFSFVSISYLLVRILCSTLLTVLMVMAIEFVRSHH